MKDILELIKSDPRYQKNIEFGEPRPGHPEGKVRLHIFDLERNLEILKLKGISPEDYWRLLFIIHVHDTFKAEAHKGVPTLHPRNHASIAREYASHYVSDVDILSVIQFHDENYRMWKEFKKTGRLESDTFKDLLENVSDWNLFLMFIVIDGCTNGKDYEKLYWFIDEVRKHRHTYVDQGWILAQTDAV